MRAMQITCFLLGCLLWQAVPAALTNQLKDHPSPYLALHGNDPVAWQTWSQDTLDIARRENKLLFVSVGYFACHWCHVMQRESFSDAAIAKQLNAHFIPVKVDRELNPALDAYLIDFVQRTLGQAGWPLNVFVTPDGNPVVGTVYLPRDRLQVLLRDVAEVWQNNNAYLQEMAAKAAALQKGDALRPAPLAPGLGEKYLAGFVQQALDIADDMAGGFGEQSKFPMIDQLRVLLSVYGQNDQQNTLPQLGQFLQTTLDHMASQGLRDQVGGGFYRYTVDPNWQTPHYEKMLYDNAGLALLYLEAAQVFQRNDYRAVGRETLDFMIRELMTPDGGMVASLSAVDGANVEGGYYLWDKATLNKLLSQKEYEVLSLLWGLDRAPETGAGYLPKQMLSPAAVAQQLHQPTAQVMGLITQAQGKLLRARQQRKLPVDTKQLASWNGLALSAMARGAQLDKGEKYRDAARRLRSYLVKRLWDGKRLSRALNQGGSLGQAGLEDYAYAAQGLYDWAAVSGDAKDRQLVRQWLASAWQRFYTPSGWVHSDEMLIKQDLGVAVMEDGPLPSPSGTLLRVSWRVALASHDKKLQQQVLAALGLGHELLEQQPFYYASQIALLAEVQKEDFTTEKFF